MYIVLSYIYGIPVPKKSTSCTTQVFADMLFVMTQVWSSTILVILELEGKGRRRKRQGGEKRDNIFECHPPEVLTSDY